MRLLEINENLEFLSAEFPEIKFKKFRSSPQDYMHCFSAILIDEEHLRNSWRDISSIIAGDFQTTLKDEFEIWNIYLLLVVNTEISKHLRYEIENDRFSMRKMVVTKSGDVDIFNIEEYLNNEILGIDIKLSESFNSNKSIIQESQNEFQSEVMKLINIENPKKESIEDRLEQVKHLASWISKK
ncbi:hypothetical protein FG473_002926 [Yersinia enterocolitica]|nr:hypothetical protein [Yersinia enterocolitica]